MKTDDLVRLLARSGGASDLRRAERRFALLHGLGGALCLGLILGTVGLRQDWREAFAAPMPWLKQLFPAAVLLLAFACLRRLARPGVEAGAMPRALALPFVAIALPGLLVLSDAAPAERMALLLGHSWWQCTVSIGVVSVPACMLSLRALRGMAPTRLRLAGAAAGLFAGGAGAFAYGLACTETQLPFLATWYGLGMFVPAGVGAWLGPRVLRW